MLTRIITAIIGIPFLLFVIIKGGIVLEASIIVVAMIGVKEMFSAFTKAYKPLKKSGYLSAIFIITSMIYDRHLLGAVIGMVMVGTLITLVIKYPEYTIVDVSVTIFGMLYVAILFPFVYLTREMPLGEFFVWLIFISAWGTDTCAYFTGTFLGKHKLAPLLSPNKTIEGAVGGVIGAAFIGIVYTWVYGTYYNVQVRDYLLIIPIITALTSVIAQLGDLTASAIKRFLNIKDYGNILPGHGGVIDRFDSVLFTAPFVYVMLYLLF